MSGFITFKGIRGLNVCRKPIVAVAIVAIIMGVFIVCEKEPVKASAPTSTEIQELSKEIKQSVKGLEYSDKVAKDFVKMVSGWKDEQGRPVLVVWKEKLAEAKEEYRQGEISKAQLAKTEESIAKELSQRIQKEIGPNEKFFDLADVVKNRQAQCLGYSQLFYVLGHSIGLSIKTANVQELMTGVIPIGGHVASIVHLLDDKLMMVDLAYKIVTKPFKLEKKFTEVGNYWELKDENNPFGIHRRIQLVDRNDLVAWMYINRGMSWFDSRQFTKAISDCTKAIELNPKFAEAYNNRGTAYFGLGQHNNAISDYTKAIELDPKLAKAYNNRGIAYDKLGQHTKGISDFTKAIDLNPKNAKGYYNRGLTYYKSGRDTEAISDFAKAIKLDPKHALAYAGRGSAYCRLEKSEEALKDLLRAIELNPSLKAYVKKISNKFKLGLKLD